MTVSVNDAYTTFIGDGVTTSFNYDFPCDTETELTIIIDDVEQESGYTVNLTTKTITFSTAPDDDAAGIIARNTVIDQTVDYNRASNSASLAALGAQLDAIVYKLQELYRDVQRALKAQIGTEGGLLPTPAADRYLGWNGAGTALENKLLAAVGTVTVSTDNALGATGDLDVPAVKAVAEHLVANYQPLDSDLSAIAALTTTTFGRAFLALANEAAFKAAVNLEIGVDVPAYASAAKLDVEDQTLTGGARVTSKNLGTVSSGTLTPDPGDRQMQHYTNNGAHTLAPGTNVGSYLLDITNGASAGAITTSGWTKVSGAAFTTTNGHKFRCSCTIGNGGSLLIVEALQ